MINIFLKFINTYPYLFIGVVLSEIFLFLLAIHFTKIRSFQNYQQVQKIHQGEVSRIAGLCILIALFIGFSNRPFMYEREMIYGLLFCFTPILFVTIFEDVHIHLKPQYRMLAMALASALVLFTTIHSLPELSLPVLGSVLNLPYVLHIFYAIALIGLMNGMNFIDGANGLLAVTLISSFFGLALIAFLLNDFDFLMMILLFSTPLFVFLVFNYPWGKIFMGDVGAYGYGWVIGIMMIYFFSKHDNLLTWSAVLLVFYPFMEVTFSVLRKIIQKKSPFQPDSHHLHLKIYFMFDHYFEGQSRRANNLVMPMLSFFWLTPPMLAVLFYQNLFLTLCSIAFLIIIYIWLYLFIPSKKSN